MARNRNYRDHDERLSNQDKLLQAEAPADEGNEEGGLAVEPVLPIVHGDEGELIDQAEQHAREQEGAEYTYARDDSDRLGDEREMQERQYTDAERLKAFQLSMFQNHLPALPQELLPGWHLCWLTTNNPRDSIQGRFRLGYELLRPEELPGFEHSILSTGPYAGYVGIQEMVAAKLPMRLYELYMMEAHHNAPLAEEGRLRATLDAIREQAKGERAPMIMEEGTAHLGTRTRKPSFEGVHPPRRVASE